MARADILPGLDTVIEALPHAVIVADLDGVVLHANREAGRLVGRDRDELRAVRLDAILPGVCCDRESLTELVASTTRDGHASHVEVAIPGDRGAATWFEVDVSALETSTDRFALVHFTDITARREAQQAVRDSEQRLRDIFESSPIPIWVEDFSDVRHRLEALQASGVADLRAYLREHPDEVSALIGRVRVVDVNQRSVDFLGAPSKELLRREVGKYLDLESSDVLAGEFAALAGGALAFEDEIRARNALGEPRWVQQFVAIMPGHEQDWSRVLVSFVDVTARREAEDWQRATSERLNRAMEAAGLRWYEVDVANDLALVDDRLACSFGYEPGELGQSVDFWMSMVHPDDLPGARARVTGDASSLGWGDVEYRMRHKDGHWVWLRDVGRTWKDASGSLRTSGFLQDITEKKRAEAERHDSELRYASVFHNTTLGIVISRVSGGQIVEVNDGFLQITGYRREEVLGRTSTELGLWADPGLRLRLRDELLRTGRSLDQEVRIRRKDGSLADVLLSGAVVQSMGEPCIIAMLHDITPLREVEQRLRENQARYEALGKSALDGLIVVGADGRVLEVNDVYCAMLGYTREQLTTMCIADIEAVDTPERIQARREDLARRGWDRFETRHRRADGTLLDGEVSIVMLPSTGQALCFFRDLTTEKRAAEALRRSEEQLRQAQKMEAIGRLAGGVAHDFNNLLTVISANAEVALGRLRDSDPLVGDLTEIRKAASRAATLTRQLLAFSRRQYFQPKVLGVNDVIFELEKMLHRLIGEDVELVTCLAPDLYDIKADPGQLEQVLVNLVVNARHAMPRGGRLTIETANRDIARPLAAHDGDLSPGKYMLLSVSDTGHGIAPDVMARIFEPFFTTKSSEGGTGLGLAMVYGIVKQSGGNVIVRSELDKGTTFEIYLPCEASKRDAALARDSRTSQPRGGETILLVEDEEAVRSLVRRVLVGAGYRVLVAGDGGEALLITEREKGPIDLVLTDVIMPRMSGGELVERLAAIRPGLKVLFASGYTDDALEHHGVGDRGFHFIAKPFNVTDIRRKVREVLDSTGGAGTPE